MRAVIVGFLLLLFAFPAFGQASVSAPLLRVGTSVRYLPVGDTSWVAGRVVRVGNCLSLAASSELSAAGAQGGFSGIFFSSVSAVETRRDTSWVRVSETELSALRVCKVGP